ncbi:MAG TPA: hypothetical protein VGR16_10395 [Thermomicrobiales bacterium]|nr:hypothetical protein [Thermomicrobiales bacterium]
MRGLLRRTDARHIALLTIVAVAIWLPRAMALDRTVTPDEHIWLARSANFYYALAHADLAGTLQFIHPGVTVMWVGAAAFLVDYPSYVLDAPGQVHQWFDSSLTDVLREHGRAPLELLIASRNALVIAHTIVLAVAFLQAIKLIGRGPATIGFLLIALNPFHIGLSQLLHLDAMTGNLMFLSALALLNYRFRGQRRSHLLVSAVAAGLAWLTRSPALFLIPFAGFVLLTMLAGEWRHQPRFDARRLWRLSRAYLGWAALGLSVFVLLWPAMWVVPGEILKKMYLVTFRMASEGHELPLFYAGNIVRGDPGALFYPVTYLWRTTPVSLIGLALAAALLSVPRVRLIRSRSRGPVIMLSLFGILFIIFMSLGAKKFDRYLLPAYPPLDLVAGVGWFTLVNWLWHRPRVLIRAASPAIIALAIGAQALTAGLAYPYYLGYYNPILGGVDAASEEMMLGWGEGLDQIARHLNALPNADRLQVLTRAWPSTLSYFLEGDLVFTKFAADMRTVAAWLSSDYYVLYVTETQRELVPPALIRYFAGREPIMIARVQGFPYAYLYDLQDAPLPAYLVRNDPCATDFGNAVRFLAYVWGDEPATPSDEIEVTFYFHTLAPIEQATRVRARLLSRDGRLISAEEAVLRPSDGSGGIRSATYNFLIPRGMSPETSRFALTVYDPLTGKAVQAEDTQTDRSRGRTARLRC